MADNTDNTDIINAAQDAVNGLLADADTAVNELKSVASSYFTPDMTQTNFDGQPSWELLQPSNANVTVGAAPNLPDSIKAWANDLGREVSLGDTPTLDAVAWELEKAREIRMAGLGDLPADRPIANLPEFVFNPEDIFYEGLMEKYAYQSEFFDNFLEDELIDFITNESKFITQEVQDSIFNEQRQRDLQILNDSLDGVNRQQATRGFANPNSMLTAARNEVVLKYQNTYIDRNKEVTALIADRAHQGRMHDIDAGIKMEDIRAQFKLGFGQLYLRTADYLVAKYQADISAALGTVNQQLDLIKLQASIDTTMSANDLRYQDHWSQMHTALLNAAIDEFRTDARFVEVIADIDKQMSAQDMQITDIDARMQTTLINAYMEKYGQDAKVNLVEAELEVEKTKFEYQFQGFDQQKQLARLQSVISEVNANVDTWKTSAAQRTQAAAKAVDHYSAAATGWAGQINAIDYLDKT